MKTTQGLHELIRSRLIEKRGNVKLSENTDIILYGKALGINENQLLFKILEIEDTIDWTKEKANVNKSETFTASPSTNVIYCDSCHAANEKGLANFCVDCGAALKQEPVKAQEQFVAPPGIPKKSKMPYILGAIALLVIIILGVLLYVKNKERDRAETDNIPADFLGTWHYELENGWCFNFEVQRDKILYYEYRMGCGNEILLPRINKDMNSISLYFYRNECTLGMVNSQNCNNSVGYLEFINGNLNFVVGDGDPCGYINNISGLDVFKSGNVLKLKKVID